MTEIEMPTSVPTIQGLMILALREAEMGHTSLAWLYSGMYVISALRSAVGGLLECSAQGLADAARPRSTPCVKSIGCALIVLGSAFADFIVSCVWRCRSTANGPRDTFTPVLVGLLARQMYLDGTRTIANI